MVRASTAAVLLAATGVVSAAASGAVSIVSRFSEVTQTNWSNQVPTTVDTFGTTTALGLFKAPSLRPIQTSTVGVGGATYSGSTGSVASSGPPAGSGRFGSYTRSRFEFTFTVTDSADFTLTGSLRRFWSATSVLRLDPLSPGASAARIASATGSTDNDFAANLVNWSGTLAAGTYKLSIDESGQESDLGLFGAQSSVSSFTFVIPTPSSLALLAAAAFPLARRRRV